MKCPFCLQHIQSEIILKPEFISVALGISLFVIVPHLSMMVLAILLMHFTASRKHRCPLCERELGHDGKFLMYFTDEVYSLSLFSAGFIFTKKTLATALMLAFICLIMTARVAQMNRDKWVLTTWQQYREECTAAQPSHCLEKYRGKEFRNWEGHLLRLQDNRENARKYYLHALSLFMKMEPGVAESGQPDVLLTLSSEAVYYGSEAMKGLQHGDLLRFNCTLHEKYSGGLKDVMHFHVEGLEVVGHDAQYALYTSEIEEEWIRLHVENKGMLTSEEEQPKNSTK